MYRIFSDVTANFARNRFVVPPRILWNHHRLAAGKIAVDDVFQHILTPIAERTLGSGRSIFAGERFREDTFHATHEIARVIAEFVYCCISKNRIAFRRRAELIFISVKINTRMIFGIAGMVRLFLHKKVALRSEQCKKFNPDRVDRFYSPRSLQFFSYKPGNQHRIADGVEALRSEVCGKPRL